MNELSLFSGYGGMSLGLRLAALEVTTVGYVEIEPYCQQIIQARINDQLLSDAPIWPDIRAFDGSQCRGVVDIITASFPCQPHSSANKRRRGRFDQRNLWPDTLRVIRDVEPRYVLLENVRGLADGDNPYAAEIIGQLSEAGYDARWGLLSAAEVGAPHKRERWWCLAVDDSQHVRCPVAEEPDGARSRVPDSTARTQESEQPQRSSRSRGGNETVADTEIIWHWQQLQGARGTVSNASPLAPDYDDTGWWAAEPQMGRMVDGYPYRVDAIRALANGIVPQVEAKFLLRRIP
jgi:DNA (cytosine-5)-methyltransferase 1